jgi:hypothetical protein
MTGNASVVSDEDLQELGEYELQAVYTLTGQTGSSMYMAPEVFMGGQTWLLAAQQAVPACLLLLHRTPLLRSCCHP